mmetsp:Transcript_2032/g.13079  ORF Transcript_2032/g.13079 Transcript_2032/m.13079 type:complete len:284 (+) Transcript_2032:1194-2045(+)
MELAASRIHVPGKSALRTRSCRSQANACVASGFRCFVGPTLCFQGCIRQSSYATVGSTLLHVACSYRACQGPRRRFGIRSSYRPQHVRSCLVIHSRYVSNSSRNFHERVSNRFTSVLLVHARSDTCHFDVPFRAPSFHLETTCDPGMENSPRIGRSHGATVDATKAHATRRTKLVLLRDVHARNASRGGTHRRHARARHLGFRGRRGQRGDTRRRSASFGRRRPPTRLGGVDQSQTRALPALSQMGATKQDHGRHAHAMGCRWDQIHPTTTPTIRIQNTTLKE